MPTWATITQWRPITTLWAICTRLSILVPSPITVSRLAPRSIVLLAPISTSSWMMTRPDLRHLQMPLRAHGEAEAVLADADAGMKDHPVAEKGVRDGGVGADGAIPADPDAGADDRMRADEAAGADLRVGPDHRAGIDLDAVLRAARSGGRRSPGDVPVEAKRAFGPHGRREEQREDLGEDAIGLRRHQGDASLPGPWRQSAGSPGTAPARVAPSAAP